MPDPVGQAQQLPAAQAVSGEEQASETCHIRCPRCNKLSEWRLAFTRANRGRTVRCPHCESSMRIE